MAFFGDAIGNYFKMGDQQQAIQQGLQTATDEQQKAQLEQMLASLNSARGDGFFDYMGNQTVDHLRGKVGLDPNNPLPPSITGMYTPQQMMSMGPQMLSPTQVDISGALNVPKGTKSFKDKLGEGLMAMIGG